MALDWLYGPKVLGANPQWMEFNSFRLDVTDLADIAEALTAAGATRVEVHRVRKLGEQGPGSNMERTLIADALTASDADLRNVEVRSWRGPDVGPTVWLAPYRATLLAKAGELDPELSRRVAQIITENGRRRIQPYRLARIGYALWAALLLGIWAWLAVIAWPLVPVIILGGCAAYLTHVHSWRWLNEGLRRHSWFSGSGRATIDAETRTALRSKRWSDKRDLKVAAATVLGTLVAGAVVALLAGQWKL